MCLYKTATLSVVTVWNVNASDFFAIAVNLLQCIDVRDSTLHVNTLIDFFCTPPVGLKMEKKGEINTRKWSLIRPFSDKGSIYIE